MPIMTTLVIKTNMAIITVLDIKTNIYGYYDHANQDYYKSFF